MTFKISVHATWPDYACSHIFISGVVVNSALTSILLIDSDDSCASSFHFSLFSFSFSFFSVGRQESKTFGSCYFCLATVKVVLGWQLTPSGKSQGLFWFLTFISWVSFLILIGSSFFLIGQLLRKSRDEHTLLWATIFGDLMKFLSYAYLYVYVQDTFI